MPAPTALKKADDDQAAQAAEVSLPQQDGAGNTAGHDDEILLDAASAAAALSADADAVVQPPAPENPDADTEMTIDEESRPRFAPAKDVDPLGRIEKRTVPIPPHRFSPLRTEWPTIYPPLVEHLKLQVRMNIHKKAVELRTSRATTDAGAIQKGADFLAAFALGFDTQDAIALLRLDDLYITTFEVKDVKTLSGDHLSRAIARLAGTNGKTKYAIENATRTRIVLADSKIHIMGGFKNINIAREACVSLILGKQPGKVYEGLRVVAGRMKERF